MVVTWYNPTQDYVQNALSYAWYFDQIIIVDNTEGNNTALAAQIPNALYIPNNKNLGVGKALNQGIEAALIENSKGREYRWVMTMDQDSAWEKEQLEKYISLCIERNEQDETVKSFSPNTRIPSHSTLGIWKRKIYSFIAKKQYQEKKDKGFGFVDFVRCSGNAVEIEVWQKVGRYNDVLFIDYVDNDFCWKLREAGYKIFRFDNVSMKHQTANKIKTPKRRPLIPSYLKINIPKYANNNPSRIFYSARNCLYAMKLHPEYAKNCKRDFYDRVIAFCVFNRAALRNIKIFIRAYKDYKQTLLPLIKVSQEKM